MDNKMYSKSGFEPDNMFQVSSRHQLTDIGLGFGTTTTKTTIGTYAFHALPERNTPLSFALSHEHTHTINTLTSSAHLNPYMRHDTPLQLGQFSKSVILYKTIHPSIATTGGTCLLEYIRRWIHANIKCFSIGRFQTAYCRWKDTVCCWCMHTCCDCDARNIDM